MNGHRYDFLERMPANELDYFDRQSIDLDRELTPIEAYEQITRHPSRLVQGLFTARDILGYPLGIRPIKGFGAAQRQERDGIEYLDFFELISCDQKSLKLAASDHHLDVLIDIQTSTNDDRHTVSIEARVKCKNGVGRIYMIPVRPIHRLLVKSMLKKL